MAIESGSFWVPAYEQTSWTGLREHLVTLPRRGFYKEPNQKLQAQNYTAICRVFACLLRGGGAHVVTWASFRWSPSAAASCLLTEEVGSGGGGRGEGANPKLNPEP